MPFFDPRALAAPLAVRGSAIRDAFNRSDLFRGNNRLVLLGGGVLLLAGVGAWLATRGGAPEQPPTQARPPVLDGLPGNANTNEFQRRLLAEAEERAAREAEQAGKSFAASIAGRTPAPAQPAPAAQPPASQQAPTITYTPNLLQSPANTTQRAGNQTSRDSQEDKEAQAAYRAQMLAMIAGWAPKAAALGLELTPDAVAKRQEERQTAHARQIAARQAAAPASGPASYGGGGGGRAGAPRGAVVMPALRWSMAKTVTATDSTAGGGLVVVDMIGGPLRGARLQGTAQKSGRDRMAVSLNRMEWRGRTVPVNAVLVSPLTKETKIASEVQHHYAARLLFPALASAVSAAGQAVALGGSTVSTGLLGTTGTLRRLNTGEIGAVAAGGAATNLQQILTEMAPREATVSLHADEVVGVMFLEDVTDPG